MQCTASFKIYNLHRLICWSSYKTIFIRTPFHLKERAYYEKRFRYNFFSFSVNLYEHRKMLEQFLAVDDRRTSNRCLHHRMQWHFHHSSNQYALSLIPIWKISIFYQWINSTPSKRDHDSLGVNLKFFNVDQLENIVFKVHRYYLMNRIPTSHHFKSTIN